MRAMSLRLIINRITPMTTEEQCDQLENTDDHKNCEDMLLQ